eukprot:TRINITY_DN220_c0_g3_i1.p1 TRINITY_DN220_c0_g3~~TRINITY_DN220_c0_g3_i1.p1  ORF type:complete len:169 (+),score=53.07 TRINITY_DN220_c0_g3_i1:69-509(+)
MNMNNDFMVSGMNNFNNNTNYMPFRNSNMVHAQKRAYDDSNNGMMDVLHDPLFSFQQQPSLKRSRYQHASNGSRRRSMSFSGSLENEIVMPSSSMNGSNIKDDFEFMREKKSMNKKEGNVKMTMGDNQEQEQEIVETKKHVPIIVS